MIPLPIFPQVFQTIYRKLIFSLQPITHTPSADQQGQNHTNNENGQRQTIQKNVKPKAENTEEQHSVTRSGRVSRKPAYFKDYV